MFHANTRRLIDYWDSAKADAPAPTRRAVEPSVLAALLPQVFILGRIGEGAFRFRLAGGFVADLHGADLREVAFASLWRQAARPHVARTLDALARTSSPLVLAAELWNVDAAAPVELEISLLPLAADASGLQRVFGLYQPTSAVSRLLGRGPVELGLKAVSPAGGRHRPTLRLVARDGLRVD